MTDASPRGAESYFARGNQHGVLVLHGFTGDTTSMRPLADRLVDAGYTVDLPLLPGHGAAMAEFLPTRWDDYYAAAASAFDALAQQCDTVAVVGLSMGATLATALAEARDDVRALVVINPFVLYPGDELTDALQDLLDAGIETIDPIGGDVKRAEGREATSESTPLAALLSLFHALIPINADLHRVHAPCLLLSSREDHTVTPENGDVFAAGVSGPVERHWLENSYHVATLDNDQAFVESTICTFLAKEFAR